MDLYFFLDNSGFEPAITVSSYSPTGLLPDKLDNDVFVCMAYPEDGSWVVRTYKQLTDYSTLSMKASDLDLPRGKVSSTLIFLSSEKMGGKYSELPQVSGFKSTPSWRANIRILGEGTSVSYQGEMPYAMTRIKGGSILSLIPFIQDAPTIKNYLFFVSFENEPAIRMGTLEIRNIQSKQTLKIFNIESNKANCLDLSGIKLDGGQLLLVTKGIMGIPIFFSVDEHGRKMSLEHTMTPTEYAIYGEQNVRRAIMKRMKAFWN